MILRRLVYSWESPIALYVILSSLHRLPHRLPPPHLLPHHNLLKEAPYIGPNKYGKKGKKGKIATDTRDVDTDDTYNTFHAEEMVITQVMTKYKYRKWRNRLLKNPNNFVLVVIRINPRGQLVQSCPCSNCKKILTDFKIKHVIYSTTENTLTFSKVDDLPEHYTIAFRINKRKMY